MGEAITMIGDLSNEKVTFKQNKDEANPPQSMTIMGSIANENVVFKQNEDTKEEEPYVNEGIIDNKSDLNGWDITHASDDMDKNEQLRPHRKKNSKKTKKMKRVKRE